MTEIHKLRAQLSGIVETYFPEDKVELSTKLPPPSDKQVSLTML